MKTFSLTVNAETADKIRLTFSTSIRRTYCTKATRTDRWIREPQFTLAAIQPLWSLWRTPRQLYRRIMMCYVSCIYSNISTCLLGQHFYFFTCDIKSAWMCSLFQSISRECSLNVWMWAKHITLKNTVLIVRRSRVDKRQTIFKNNMFSFPQPG